MDQSTWKTQVGLAEMLKGGVILDVVDAEQARIAEEAGAVAVMALERVPAQIRKEGGVARASDPAMIRSIQEAVSIPVMAKCRIGHFMEARILEALEVDFIDESEVLTPADEEHHIDKRGFKVPFVCGCRDLGEALRRIGEGAALIRTKGEAGTGDIVEAVRHLRALRNQIARLAAMPRDQWMAEAKALGAPYELVAKVATTGRLPVPNFAAGGVASPSPVLTSASFAASSQCVTASTIARARFAGSFDRKTPLPTNTDSAPSAMHSAASAGVATPPAAKLGTGRRRFVATSATRS